MELDIINWWNSGIVEMLPKVRTHRMDFHISFVIINQSLPTDLVSVYVYTVESDWGICEDKMLWEWFLSILIIYHFESSPIRQVASRTCVRCDHCEFNGVFFQHASGVDLKQIFIETHARWHCHTDYCGFHKIPLTLNSERVGMFSAWFIRRNDTDSIFIINFATHFTHFRDIFFLVLLSTVWRPVADASKKSH